MAEQTEAQNVYDVVQQTPFTPAPEEDPEAVQPSTGPVSDDGDTSGEDGSANERSDQEEPLAFDPRWKDAFVGLTYLGRLTRTFTIWGHEFVVRTLTSEDHAAIALWIKPWEGTRARNSQYQVAVVALGTVSVDGTELPVSLKAGDVNLEPRVKYVGSEWMPPVREKVFDHIWRLEAEAREVLDQMGNASG